jgi:hypothetical protein
VWWRSTGRLDGQRYPDFETIRAAGGVARCCRALRQRNSHLINVLNALAALSVTKLGDATLGKKE